VATRARGGKFGRRGRTPGREAATVPVLARPQEPKPSRHEPIDPAGFGSSTGMRRRDTGNARARAIATPRERDSRLAGSRGETRGLLLRRAERAREVVVAHRTTGHRAHSSSLAVVHARKASSSSSEKPRRERVAARLREARGSRTRLATPARMVAPRRAPHEPWGTKKARETACSPPDGLRVARRRSLEALPANDRSPSGLSMAIHAAVGAPSSSGGPPSTR
jgi:hypothetical protein